MLDFHRPQGLLLRLFVRNNSVIESVGRQCPHSFGANRFFFENVIETTSSSLFLLDFRSDILRAQGSYTLLFFFFRDIPVGLCSVWVIVRGRSGTPSVYTFNCIAVDQSTAISNNRKNTLKLPYVLL